jgi:hypothetical protein
MLKGTINMITKISIGVLALAFTSMVISARGEKETRRSGREEDG